MCRACFVVVVNTVLIHVHSTSASYSQVNNWLFTPLSTTCRDHHHHHSSREQRRWWQACTCQTRGSLRNVLETTLNWRDDISRLVRVPSFWMEMTSQCWDGDRWTPTWSPMKTTGVDWKWKSKNLNILHSIGSNSRQLSLESGLPSHRRRMAAVINADGWQTDYWQHECECECERVVSFVLMGLLLLSHETAQNMLILSNKAHGMYLNPLSALINNPLG